MADRPATIDEYLARLPDDQRVALEALRQTIRSVAPEAEECISYQIPAFRLNGMLVGFGAARNHCALYPWSSAPIEAFRDELREFDTSKGTIRFQPDHPLPADLVRRIIEFRIAENDARRPAGKRRPAI